VGSSLSGLGEALLEDLIAAAQGECADDSPAMNEIVRRFQKRAMLVATTLTEQTGLHDDLAQASLIALVRAVRRHQLGRPGFLAYAMRYMMGAARRALAAWISHMPPPALLSDPDVWSAACAMPAISATTGSRCWGHGRAAQVVVSLPERQRDLLTRRYVDDAPLAVIAAATGTSIPAVSQRLATAHRAVAAQLAA
jgi:RNA polymerase sigma factor (sigma-70 family)